MMHNSVRAGREAARIRSVSPTSDGKLGLELLLDPRSSSSRIPPIEQVTTPDILALVSVQNEGQKKWHQVSIRGKISCALGPYHCYWIGMAI